MEFHRRLPHLQSFTRQPIISLTVVTLDRRACLANADAFTALTEIWGRSPELDGWTVGDYLLMPDHVHLFARPAVESKPLARWIQTWKSISARRLTRHWAGGRNLWQSDYFDRFLRSADDYTKQWNYIAMNPVRRGLCENIDDWPWRGRLGDLRF